MAITPAPGTVTPLNPFNEFLSTAGKWQEETPPQDYTKRAVIAISAGNYASDPSSANPTISAARGLTASGLYGLLKIAETSGIPAVQLQILTSTNATGRDISTSSFIYDTPAAFVNHLNSIHNNINE
jgi:hypothetical protein